MSELKGPSAIEIKNFIKENNLLEFHLVNSSVLVGQIMWHDESAFHLQLEDDRVITVLKTALLYYSKIR